MPWRVLRGERAHLVVPAGLVRDLLPWDQPTGRPFEAKARLYVMSTTGIFPANSM